MINLNLAIINLPWLFSNDKVFSAVHVYLSLCWVFAWSLLQFQRLQKWESCSYLSRFYFSILREWVKSYSISHWQYLKLLWQWQCVWKYPRKLNWHFTTSTVSRMMSSNLITLLISMHERFKLISIRRGKRHFQFPSFTLFPLIERSHNNQILHGLCHLMWY